MTDRLRVEKITPTLEEISPSDERELMEGDTDGDDAARERQLAEQARDAAKFKSALKEELAKQDED